MSEFFRDIYGTLRDPLGNFNQNGALPPRDVSDSMYSGMIGMINNGSELLGGQVDAYNRDPSFSSELAYLNIAHSLMKVIQPITIPESGEHNGNFKLTHSVSYGGLAFSLKIPRNSVKEVIDNAHTVERAGLSPEAHVNLAIVNYLFHGMQRYCFSDDTASTGNLGPGKDAWQFFYRSLKIPKDIFPTKAVRNRTPEQKLKIALWLQEHFIKCFGVVHASDRQGGQHQSNSNPIVTYPVDYVVNVVVDGKVMNMTNIWRHLNINAGDDLILRLRYVPATEYTLVAYPKNLTRKTYPPFEHPNDGVWQLVPDIFDVVYRDPLDYADGPMRAALPTENINVFDYREQGYWHVARSHAYWGQMPVADIWGNDELQYNGNGALLQATFAPEFMDPLRGDMDTTYSSIMGLETEEDPFTLAYETEVLPYNARCIAKCREYALVMEQYLVTNDTPVLDFVIPVTDGARVHVDNLRRHVAALVDFARNHDGIVENIHNLEEALTTRTARSARETKWNTGTLDLKDMMPIRNEIIIARDNHESLKKLVEHETLMEKIHRDETVYGQMLQVYASACKAMAVVFTDNPATAVTVNRPTKFKQVIDSLANKMKAHLDCVYDSTATKWRFVVKDSMRAELTQRKYIVSAGNNYRSFDEPLEFGAPAATDEPMQVDAVAAAASEPTPAPANNTTKKKRGAGAGAAVI